MFHQPKLTSSNGLVSLKQDSQTSLTTFVAISSDSQDGLPTIDNIARRLTHACYQLEFDQLNVPDVVC
jgi:hypothetical protein